MNKDELIKEVQKLKKEKMQLKNNNNYLLSQQTVLKKMAEKAGSDVATWKHRAIRAEEDLHKTY